nr:TlpA disulfide reductase family protein [uncultured Carboxylicivirga sp.]
MKYLIVTIIVFVSYLNGFGQEIIEIPLTSQYGYGCFNYWMSGMSPNSDDEDNPWRKTHLKVEGVPSSWENVKIGDIETNIYQNVYQSYFNGNISEEMYELLLKSWSYWKPDSSTLTKEFVKTKIAFAAGIDSLGKRRLIVDANNNLDFSDDESFIPSIDGMPMDSIALENTITVSYERYFHNKIEKVTTPVFISYDSDRNMYFRNFPQYSIARFNGQKIEVCSQFFGDLSYERPVLALIDEDLNDKNKIGEVEVINKNDIFEIDGKQYKFICVNTNKGTLNLEEVAKSEDKTESSQIGYKAKAFSGNDFLTGAAIDIDKLKGKVIFLDFWAVWCAPCREELPKLKELYEKTSKENFEMISIVGGSNAEELRKLSTIYGISWPQILSSESNNIIKKFGVSSYPTTLLIDQKGIIIAKNLRAAELEKKLEEILR